MKNSYGCMSQKPFCVCQEPSASNCRAGVAGVSQRDGRKTHKLKPERSTVPDDKQYKSLKVGSKAE